MKKESRSALIRKMFVFLSILFVEWLLGWWCDVDLVSVLSLLWWTIFFSDLILLPSSLLIHKKLAVRVSASTAYGISAFILLFLSGAEHVNLYLFSGTIILFCILLYDLYNRKLRGYIVAFLLLVIFFIVLKFIPPEEQVSDLIIKSSTRYLRAGYMKLRGQSVTDESIAYLFSRKNRIRALDLSDTAITNASLPLLNGHMKIRTLILNGTNITDQGIESLDLDRLQVVGFSRTQISTGGILPLLNRCPLERLNLSFTAVDDTLIPTLCGIETLQWVNLTGTQISEEAVETLRSTCPRVHVVKEAADTPSGR